MPRAAGACRTAGQPHTTAPGSWGSPGVSPLRVPDGVTAHSWYTYHWRWLGAASGGLPKFEFARALRAEGIPLFHGYTPLNRNQAVRDEIARLGAARSVACPGERREGRADPRSSCSRFRSCMGTRADLDDVVERLPR